MKTNFLKHIVLLGLLTGFSVLVQAQTLVEKASEAAFKSTAEVAPAVVDAAARTAWRGFTGGPLPTAEALRVASLPQTTVPASTITATTPSSLSATIHRSMPGLTTDFYTRIMHMPRTQALRTTIEKGGSRLNAGGPWSSVVEGEMTVPTLKGLTLDGFAGPSPEIPLPKGGNKIYGVRGLGLDEPAIRNILRNGLRLQDLGKNAGDLGVLLRTTNLSSAAPVTRSMMKNAIEESQVTWLTPNPQVAAFYARRNSFEDGKIPVLVTVRNERTIGTDANFEVAHDIPAENIVEMSALVKGPDGNPIWVRLSLMPDQSFRINPYRLRLEP